MNDIFDTSQDDVYEITAKERAKRKYEQLMRLAKKGNTID